MKFGVVNKSTIVNNFVLHILQRNITHLAVITRKTNIKLGILKGGNWKRVHFYISFFCNFINCHITVLKLFEILEQVMIGTFLSSFPRKFVFYKDCFFSKFVSFFSLIAFIDSFPTVGSFSFPPPPTTINFMVQRVVLQG